MLRTVGIFALILGMLVLVVASYHSFRLEVLALEPLLLGATAVLAGFISLKKSREKQH
ncbi:MAG: hypothetical protein ACLFOZ_00665 [Cyclobacteriaceae bacterium]